MGTNVWWAEQNINVAQDMTGDAERAQKAKKYLVERGLDPEHVKNLSDSDATAIEGNIRHEDDNQKLKDNGLSDAQIVDLTPNERYEALQKIATEPSPDATAGAAAGMTGHALVGALVLGRRREGQGVGVQNIQEYENNKPRVLTDNDGNPLYFAQATSDGNTRTDGSGNVKDKGVAAGKNQFAVDFLLKSIKDQMGYSDPETLPSGEKKSLTPDEIKILKDSVIKEHKVDTDYFGNYGQLTEKKLIMLERAGLPPAELKKLTDEIVKLRKGSKGRNILQFPEATDRGAKHVLSEYRRILDGKPLEPDPVFGKSKDTSDALNKVNFNKNFNESESKYIARVGEEIHRATIGMTFESQDAVNLHIAKIAEKLAIIGDPILYGNNVNNPFSIAPMNMVGDDGFKFPDSGQTDCNRFLASVLYAAGFFPASVFSNLNTDAYLTPSDAKRRNADTIQSGGGVVFLREASQLFEKKGENLTDNDEEHFPDKEFRTGIKGEKPFPGAIGITRTEYTSKVTGKKVIQSDHVYVIVNERINPETKKKEYHVAESKGGKVDRGVTLNWINEDYHYFKRSEYFQFNLGVRDK